MQVYLKDSCEIDALENPIPLKYCRLFYENSLEKADILRVMKYIKNYRMR